MGKTIAAGTLGPPHGDQVESLSLDERLSEAEGKVIVSRHSGRYTLPEGLLPHAAEGPLERHAESLVEIRVRVGVDGEHRAYHLPAPGP